MVAKGWPWRTVIAVEWVGRATLQDGEPYLNAGTHVMRLRWGRIVYIHAYEDSQAVAEACRRLVANGVEEAAAPPITS